MADILDIAFDIGKHQSRRNLETNMKVVPVMSIDEQFTEYYFRISLKDEAGALEHMSHLFSEHSVNIKKIIQKEIVEGTAEVVVITSKVQEKLIGLLKQALEQSTSVIGIESAIRVGL